MRKVFFSFAWADVWRVNQVRNSWVTKGNYKNAGFVDAADIEKLKRSTDSAIKRWIDGQLEGTSVTCVLIGPKTSESRWVNYEIQESIDKGNGLLGVYIHNLKDDKGNSSAKGRDPIAINTIYDWDNDDGYENLDDWIEKAAKQAGRS